MPVAPIPEIDLVLLADAQTALAGIPGITVPAADPLQTLITQVSAQLQSWLSRRLPSQPYTETYDGEGTRAITLPAYPITAVASLSVDGVTIPPAPDATTAGFVFARRRVELRGYRFWPGVQNVAITYTAGFITIPQDLQRACIEGIVAVLNLSNRDPALKSEKAGDMQFVYADTEARDLARVVLTPGVTAILTQYKNVVPV